MEVERGRRVKRRKDEERKNRKKRNEPSFFKIVIQKLY
jgi:hypothetical protein